MTKLFGESLIRSSSEIPYTILRFGIVYGPRKVPGSAAESIALKVSANEDIKVGSKHTSRRFIYIDDLVSGILQSLSIDSALLNSKIFNLAGSELISLEQIVSTSNQILSKNSKITDDGKMASIRNPLIDEASKVMGWSPKIGFQEGLKNCLDEMCANQE
jgi:nucleoside-diphosphate-sugar epimerase